MENDKAFPQKANIEFIEKLDDHNIRMRVWERGAGETMACGTGACASTVASVLKQNNIKPSNSSFTRRKPINRMEQRGQPHIHDRTC